MGVLRTRAGLATRSSEAEPFKFLAQATDTCLRIITFPVLLLASWPGPRARLAADWVVCCESLGVAQYLLCVQTGYRRSCAAPVFPVPVGASSVPLDTSWQGLPSITHG